MEKSKNEEEKQTHVGETLTPISGALCELNREDIAQINVKFWTYGGTGGEHYQNLLKPGIENWNKWYDCNNSQTYVEYHLHPDTFKTIRCYSLKSANDCPGRDPFKWTLRGLQHETDKNWVTLHEVEREIWQKRHQMKIYTVDDAHAIPCCAFRLQIMSNRSAALKEFDESGTQLNEFLLFVQELEKEELQNAAPTPGEYTKQIVKAVSDNYLKDFHQIERETIKDIKVSNWTLGHYENLLLPGEENWNKWYDPSSNNAWVEYHLNEGILAPIRAYSIQSANDCPERDPYDWRLMGLDCNNQWRVIHLAQGQIWKQRHELKCFSVENTDYFQAFRLFVDQNRSTIEYGHNGSGTQLNEFFIFS